MYSGTCPIRYTKGPGKCVRLNRMSEYSGFSLLNRNTINFCQMSQGGGKLWCRVAQIPLYIALSIITFPLICHCKIIWLCHATVDSNLAISKILPRFKLNSFLKEIFVTDLSFWNMTIKKIVRFWYKKLFFLLGLLFKKKYDSLIHYIKLCFVLSTLKYEII
jgi:hypothetical protein